MAGKVCPNERPGAIGKATVSESGALWIAKKWGRTTALKRVIIWVRARDRYGGPSRNRTGSRAKNAELLGLRKNAANAEAVRDRQLQSPG